MACAKASRGKLIRLKEIKRGEGFIDLDSGKVTQPVSHLFRSTVRHKVTKIIEKVAGYDHSAITREHVICGYILSSAKIKRDRLIEPLRHRPQQLPRRI